jgi:hypothetical protein
MRGPVALLVSAMLVVAGCGSSASPSVPGLSIAVASPSAGSGGAGSDGYGVAFTVNVSFTGAAELHGSFVDTYTGRSFPSCVAYVSAALWTSPGAVTGVERIGGLPVSFDFALPPGEFAGPGNYAPGVMGRLSIGTDTFEGTESWVTLHDDGSGSGWFKGFKPVGGTATGKSESGTVIWTCWG